MKNLKAALLFAFSFLIMNGAALAQDRKTEQIQLKTSAVCKMCKKAIEKAMAYEKGVESADLDVPTQVLTVQYRPAKTNPEKIKKAVTKAGYTPMKCLAIPASIINSTTAARKTKAYT